MSRDDNLAEVRHMAERMAEGMARAGEQLREIAEGLTRNLPRPEPTECKSEAESFQSASEIESPATDPTGTVRVHPEDCPEWGEEARRAWRLDVSEDDECPWFAPYAIEEVGWLYHDQVADWPRQSLADVARVLGHEVIDWCSVAKSTAARAERLERERDDALAASERMEREHDQLRHRAERAEARPASEPMMTMRGLACPTCRQPWMGEADHV